MRTLVSIVALVVAVQVAAEAQTFGSVKMERRKDGVLTLTNNPDRPGVARLEDPVARTAAPEELRGRISYWAQQKRLDPGLVEAVVRVESAFQPSARSHTGAMGLMQLMPQTARELGVRNAYDVDENLRGGTTYLRLMLDRFGGDLHLALAGYNAGPAAVERYSGIPPYRETNDYVKRVLAIYRPQRSTIRVGSAIGAGS